MAGAILYKKNSKFYTVLEEEIIHETKMTSNNTPSPLKVFDSNAHSTYPPYLAFDGNNGTYVRTGSSGAGTQLKLTFDFGKEKKVSGIYLTHGGNTSISGIDVSGSNNGTDFTTIKNFTSLNLGSGATKKLFFDSTVKYRYFYFYIPQTNMPFLGEIKYFFVDDYLYEAKNIKAYKDFTNSNVQLQSTYKNKRYMLQDTDTLKEQGLWIQNLDKKPTSISFN
ncbi:MAG TPA: hypothetical protein DEB37_00455 [Lysinibacillus sp.]|nr:hypothetical protein [Lysinibacillus sp.]